MKTENLSKVDGKTVKNWYEWLKEEDCGCCHLPFAENGRYVYSVCMGWHDGDGWEIAWKIGRQTRNNVMQSDLDIDFEMPYVEETGDVDDTEECVRDVPSTMKGWNELATAMRKAARRVWRDWRDEANAGD